MLTGTAAGDAHEADDDSEVEAGLAQQRVCRGRESETVADFTRRDLQEHIAFEEAV